MAQIVTNKAIANRCNLQAIQSGGSKASTVLDEGEVWLVDTTNAVKFDGFGKYDSYIVGDGETAASALTLHEIDSDKQDVLTFDSTPTASSTNPVTSGGIKTALDLKADVSDTYTKAEINDMVTPASPMPIVITSDHTSISQPAVNTIYREPNNDGSGYKDWTYADNTWSKLADIEYNSGTIFDSLSELSGKSVAQKETMIPDGNVVEDLYNFVATVSAYHAAYTNRYLDSTGASKQPSSSNGNRHVVVFDISNYVGWVLNFSSYINYASGINWAVWKIGTTITSTGLSQNTDVRTTGSASAKGNFSGTYTVVEDDKWLALVSYSGHTPSVSASKSMKDQITINVAAISTLNDTVNAMNTVSKAYQEVADYQNRYLDANGVSVQPSSGNGNRRVHVWDISQLVGKEIQLTGYLYHEGVPWSVMQRGTTWGTTGGSYPANGSLVRVHGESTSGNFYDNFTVESGDVYLAIANYKSTSLKVYEEVGLGEKVSELDNYSNPSGIRDYNPMSEYLLRVKNLAHSSSSPYPLVLCHFSDIHGNDTALSRLLEWCSDYETYIDDIIHTGDSVENSYADGMTWWDAIDGSEKILNCIGNHDITASGSSGSGGMTPPEYYTRYIGNYVSNWGDVVQPDGVETSGSDHYGACYYYKDYTDKGVRLIVLDCLAGVSGGYSSTYALKQLEWFQGVLVDAANNSLTVVVAYHSHPKNSGYTRVKYPFSHMTDGSVGAYSWSGIVTAVKNFKNNQLTGQTVAGDFACWLCGHQHKDVTVWYGDDGQLSIAIDSMTLSNMGRSITGKGQDCFNLMSIDKTNHIIKLLRVGNDCDAQMRHIGMASINYTTGEVIHSW